MASPQKTSLKTYTSCYCEENVYLLGLELVKQLGAITQLSDIPPEYIQSYQQQPPNDHLPITTEQQPDQIQSTPLPPSEPHEIITSYSEDVLRQTFVLFISSSDNYFPINYQRIAPPGQTAYWDYHVILLQLPILQNVDKLTSTSTSSRKMERIAPNIEHDMVIENINYSAKTSYETQTNLQLTSAAWNHIPMIYDIDSRLPQPCHAGKYLLQSFPALGQAIHDYGRIINASSSQKYNKVLSPYAFRIIPLVYYLIAFTSSRLHMCPKIRPMTPLRQYIDYLHASINHNDDRNDNTDGNDDGVENPLSHWSSPPPKHLLLLPNPCFWNEILTNLSTSFDNLFTPYHNLINVVIATNQTTDTNSTQTPNATTIPSIESDKISERVTTAPITQTTAVFQATIPQRLLNEFQTSTISTAPTTEQSALIEDISITALNEASIDSLSLYREMPSLPLDYNITLPWQIFAWKYKPQKQVPVGGNDIFVKPAMTWKQYRKVIFSNIFASIRGSLLTTLDLLIFVDNADTNKTVGSFLVQEVLSAARKKSSQNKK